MIYKTGILVAVFALLQASCRHTADIPDLPSISFVQEVQPIIVNNCSKSGCHDGLSKFELSTYSEISGRTSPGNAHQSSLYTTVVKRSMPPSQPLSDEQAKLIYIWIMQGSKNN